MSRLLLAVGLCGTCAAYAPIGRPRPRRGLVVRAMAVEGLTVPRIRAAARQSGGYAALLTTLELGSRGVELTRGERLALATAAMSSS